MSFIMDLYNQKLAENQKNIRFWEEYINSLKSLDFSVYADKLKVPALVPVGSRMFFRGELKHTNEVTVALGADYFVKCSIKQAEVLKQHRIHNAQEKLEIFEKENQYLENQLSLSKEAVHEEKGKDIVEFHTEDEDREWREKHRENVKKHKQNKPKEPENVKTEETDDQELWNRLEELELQEELENELLSMKEDEIKSKNVKSDFMTETFMEIFTNKQNVTTEVNKNNSKVNYVQPKLKEILTKTENTANESSERESLKVAPKIELLQKVIDKQHELEERLQELRNKDRGQSKSEIDLIKKLDEMDELDELEDEMDRLEDLIEKENETSEEELTSEASEPSSKTKLKRNVSFADKHEGETLQIEFKHSDTKPCTDPYDIEKGVRKPSDIYSAFPNSFRETTSILKKTKYESAKVCVSNVENIVESDDSSSEDQTEDKEMPRTIVIKDIVERTNSDDSKVESKSRPTSLFKMRRQQQNK